MPSTPADDAALHAYLVAVFTKSALPVPSGFWASRRAGVFVTAYSRQPFTSANVVCCMSNGEYLGGNTVFENVNASANICRDRDGRMSRGKARFFSITVLEVKPWRRETLATLRREDNRAISIEVSGRQAIYLPTVWHEYSQWSADALIHHLLQKAGGREGDFSLSSAGTYEISDDTPFRERDHGFFDEHFVPQILGKILKFYRNSTTEQGLAYSVTQGRLNYDNQGAWTRTYSDITALCKLEHALGGNSAKHVLEVIPKQFKSLAGYVAWLECSRCVGNPVPIFDAKATNGVFSTDRAFANPQIVLYLIKAGSSTDVFLEFLTDCERTLPSTLAEYGVFAANWIAQALAAGVTSVTSARVQGLLRQIIPLFRELFQKDREGVRVSVTETACALSGMLALGEKRLAEDVKDYMGYWVGKMAQVQDESGAFPYWPGENTFRMDVTSHVVDVLLRLK